MSNVTSMMRHAADTRARLMNPANSPRVIEKYEAKIAALEEQLELSRDTRVSRMQELIANEQSALARVVQLENDVAFLQERLQKTYQTVTELTGEMARENLKKVDDIIREVLVDFPDFTVGQIKGPSRSAKLVEARHQAIYQVHLQRPDLSYPQLGRAFGGRDHTTALFAVAKIKAREQGKSE